MKIKLTQGYEAEIDFSDWWKVQGYNWCANINPNVVYAIAWRNRKAVYMHKLIRPNDGMVDHIDGNGLNNHMENLRPATRQQNGMNNATAVGESGYRGVKRHGPYWRASVDANGKRHHAGTYNTPAEAAKARDILAKQLHGEFAVLNFEED